jgi:hypothetical protein
MHTEIMIKTCETLQEKNTSKELQEKKTAKKMLKKNTSKTLQRGYDIIYDSPSPCNAVGG